MLEVPCKADLERPVVVCNNATIEIHYGDVRRKSKGRQR